MNQVKTNLEILDTIEKYIRDNPAMGFEDVLISLCLMHRGDACGGTSEDYLKSIKGFVKPFQVIKKSPNLLHRLFGLVLILLALSGCGKSGSQAPQGATSPVTPCGVTYQCVNGVTLEYKISPTAISVCGSNLFLDASGNVHNQDGVLLADQDFVFPLGDPHSTQVCYFTVKGGKLVSSPSLPIF